MEKRLEKQQKKMEKEMKKNVPREKASLEKIDDYFERLYEDEIKEKIAGTFLILQLSQVSLLSSPSILSLSKIKKKEPKYLPHFIENKTLIGALARILQEDRKKNVELVTNILEIFFSFSNYSQLHSILVYHKIGATSMQVISQEIKFSTLLFLRLSSFFCFLVHLRVPGMPHK